MAIFGFREEGTEARYCQLLQVDHRSVPWPKRPAQSPGSDSYWPVPVIEMGIGDTKFDVLAMMFTFALRNPVAVGENATVKLQDPPIAMVLGQGFVRM
jgi:hypothetical protein